MISDKNPYTGKCDASPCIFFQNNPYKTSDIVLGDAFYGRTQKILKRKILWRKIFDKKISQKKFRTKILAKKMRHQVADDSAVLIMK